MNAHKIAKVATIAKSAEHQSAQSLRSSRASLQQHSGQLEQLQQFKSEYENRLAAMTASGMAARQLGDYRQFLGKLSQAIDQQTRQVGASEQQMESERAQWVNRSRRSSALEQLVERHRDTEQQAADKAEQRAVDDKTLHRYLAQLAN